MLSSSAWQIDMSQVRLSVNFAPHLKLEGFKQPLLLERTQLFSTGFSQRKNFGKNVALNPLLTPLPFTLTFS
jgi:hypothetical protein